MKITSPRRNNEIRSSFNWLESIGRTNQRFVRNLFALKLFQVDPEPTSVPENPEDAIGILAYIGHVSIAVVSIWAGYGTNPNAVIWKNVRTVNVVGRKNAVAVVSHWIQERCDKP